MSRDTYPICLWGGWHDFLSLPNPESSRISFASAYPRLSGVTLSAHLQFCAERGRLLDALDGAVRDYADAAAEVLSHIGVLSVDAYGQERVYVRNVRMSAQHTREALVAAGKSTVVNEERALGLLRVRSIRCDLLNVGEMPNRV